MPKYTCRFLNDANRIDDVTIFESVTDDVAQLRAKRLLEKSDFSTMELWQLDRLVVRDQKTP